MGILSKSSVNVNSLGSALVETIYAEYGSAVEMLYAAHSCNDIKLRAGFIRHSIDEYRHVKILQKILEIEAAADVSGIGIIPRFTPNHAFYKGYLERNLRLFEKYNEKVFTEFVFSNELLAKESFEKLLRSLQSSESKFLLTSIMEDELNHHGMAKRHFLKSYPEYQLSVAFNRERLKNKFRMLVAKNSGFLDKVFYPFSLLFASLALIVVRLIPSRINSETVNVFEKPGGGIL